jgi:hypothetical protein
MREKRDRVNKELEQQRLISDKIKQQADYYK